MCATTNRNIAMPVIAMMNFRPTEDLNSLFMFIRTRLNRPYLTH